MATSGTVGTTVFQTRKLVEHAFGRCKVKRAMISEEMGRIALDCLWLTLMNLSNRSVQLWAINSVILPLYENQRRVVLPTGSVGLLAMPNLRTLTRLTDGATVVSSAGGTVDFAFDDDFETSLTQTSPNGNVSAQWADDVLVTSVGLLPNASGTWTFSFERSDDGSTWTTIETHTAVTITAGEWKWYDLDGSLAAPYFRVVASGGTTLDLRELFLGNNPREIPMAQLNVDDWMNVPDKTSTGMNPVQFYLDLQRTTITLNLWPVPSRSARYAQVTALVERQLEDVGSLSQEIEAPPRWYDALIWDLSWRLAAEVPEVTMDWTTLFKIAEAQLDLAERGESDMSSSTLAVDISPYTRG